MSAADSIFVDEYEVARLTGRSIITVRQWRQRLPRFGPPRAPVGQGGGYRNSVRYRRADVIAWALANPNQGRGRRKKAA